MNGRLQGCTRSVSVGYNVDFLGINTKADRNPQFLGYSVNRLKQPISVGQINIFQFVKYDLSILCTTK